MSDNSKIDADLMTPAGSGTHRVVAGDTMGSIAQESGHHIDTLMDDPGNRDVVGERTSPEILLPGDQLTIPPIRNKEVEVRTGTKYTFVRDTGGAPSLRLVFSFNDKPRADVPYELRLDGGAIKRGVTDSDGVLEETITHKAVKGVIRLEDEDRDYEIMLGLLDPIKTVSGVAQRLANLGFDCDENESGSVPSERLRGAIKAFRQMDRDGEKPNVDDNDISDRLDEDLFLKLESKHGS